MAVEPRNAAGPSMGPSQESRFLWRHVLVIAIAFDLILLPSIYIFGFPIKISYFLLSAHVLVVLANGRISKQSGNLGLALLVFSLITLCGELISRMQYPLILNWDTVRIYILLALSFLAFSTGQSCQNFNPRLLIPILIIASAFNLALVFGDSKSVTWLAELYYSEATLRPLNPFGVSSVQDLLAMERSRGLFGNPNVSAHLVNIVALMIVVGLRMNDRLRPRLSDAILLTALPLSVSLGLASRGETIVSCFIALMVIASFFRLSNVTVLAILGSLVTLFFAVVGAVIFHDSLDMDFAFSTRLSGLLQLLTLSGNGMSEVGVLDSWKRPLLTIEQALPRFLISPILGTGFSAGEIEPFVIGTNYFHNDLIWMLVVSGGIGMALFLSIFLRFAHKITVLMLVPLVLPGLVNTFVLNVPSMIFYFLMAGIFMAQKNNRETGK